MTQTRPLLEPSDLHGFTAEVERERSIAFWLRFEVQRDENELRLWNQRAERGRGVCWSGMSGAGEKPVMRSDAERLAAAVAVYERQLARKAVAS